MNMMKAIITVSVVIFALFRVTCGQNCPGNVDTDSTPCRCYEYSTSEVNIYCERTSLDEILDLLNGYTFRIRTLAITETNIATLPDNVFDGLNINTLSLYDCGIEEIEVNAFAGLVLETLELGSNKLTQIPIEALSSQNRLKNLDLSDNLMIEIPSRVFNSSGKHFERLERISFTHNQITTLQADTFVGLEPDLDDVHLYSNKIDAIETGAFNEQNRLFFIFLDDNELTDISDTMWEGLGLTVWLHLSDNKITALPRSSFPTFINNLDLHGNKITELGARTFANQLLNGVIDLSNNMIKNIDKNAFARNIPFDLISPAHVFLQNNELTSIADETFKHTKQLYEINLSANKFTKISTNMFMGADKIGFVNFQDNEISSIETGAFQNKERLHHLFLTRNQLTEIDSSTFATTPGLRQLHLGENQITSIHEDTFSGINRLGILFLNDNKLTTLDRKTFASSANSMQQLWLQNNKFDDTLWTALTDITWSLWDIDLRNNSMHTVPEHAFNDKVQLNHVLLGNNKISNIGKGAFRSHLVVDLTNNDISTIKASSFIYGHSPNRLVMEGNPIHCDCEVMWMVEMDGSLEGGVCSSPPKLAGTIITDLDDVTLTCYNITLEISNIVTTFESITVTWTLNDESGEAPVSVFKIEYNEYPNYEVETIVIDDPLIRNYMIEELTPAVLYSVCVTVIDELDRPYTDCANIMTTIEDPEPETDVVAIVVTAVVAVAGLLLLQVVIYCACCRSEKQTDLADKEELSKNTYASDNSGSDTSSDKKPIPAYYEIPAVQKQEFPTQTVVKMPLDKEERTMSEKM